MRSTSHVSSEAGATPTAPGRYVDVDVEAITPVEFVPGLEFRPVLGERTITDLVRFAPHTVAPVHVHEEEQIVLLLEGEFHPDSPPRRPSPCSQRRTSRLSASARLRRCLV